MVYLIVGLLAALTLVISLLIFSTAKRKQDMALLEKLTTSGIAGAEVAQGASHQDVVDLANGLHQEFLHIGESFNQVGEELGTLKNTQEQMIEIIGQLQQTLVAYNQSATNKKAGANTNVESHKNNI